MFQCVTIAFGLRNIPDKRKYQFIINKLRIGLYK
ncbi:hypothetical protein [Clostridium psychrophilum]|nr:hypothetical protein [Clostridium psychrophilum]